MISILVHLEIISGRGSILAQGDMEVDYPDLPGIDTPDTTDAGTYLRYLYVLGIFLAGLISFVLLIKAGMRYLTSAGNPSKIQDAREQITASLLALLIIFGSYLILNTINPELLRIHFPSISIPPSAGGPVHPAPPPPTQFQEYPVGALITSEIGVSSFIATSSASTTDPDTDDEEYNNLFPEIIHYPTDYQGGLHGRRLKRVHEVASTTLPVVDRLEMLSNELLRVAKKLEAENKKLYDYAMECDCRHCPSCTGGEVSSCPCPLCAGDPCPNRAEMNKLREEIIPAFYENSDSPLPCRMVILDYFASAFKPFLDSPEELVKTATTTYEDISYWHEGEGMFSGEHVDDMRSQIEACISAGEIEQEEYDWPDDPDNPFAVEQLIDLMADVENKGTYSPTTTPPERDVQTNIAQIEDNLILLEKCKIALNPEHPNGCWPQAYSFHQNFRLSDTFDIDIRHIQLENVKSLEDPATFYCPLRVVDSESSDMFLEDVPIGLPCSPMVEIPIGNTIDDSIQLMADILRELGDPGHPGIPRDKWDPLGLSKKGIWNSGHQVIDNSKKQNELSTSTAELSDELIELTKDEPGEGCRNDCAIVGCEPECQERTKNVYDDEGNVVGTETYYYCVCPCKGDDPCPVNEINSTWGKIQQNVNRIEQLYEDTKNAKKRIYESFFKLNSEYPEEIPEQGEWVDPETVDPNWVAGERAAIGEDLCCEDPDGECRNPDNIFELILADDKIVKRDYTLKEKLISIQKLFNRSRDWETYKYLIEELVAMNLDFDNTVIEEYTNIPADFKKSLAQCESLAVDIGKVTEGLRFARDILEGCCFVKSEEYGHIASQYCSPNPPYDCDYFNPLLDGRTPLLCHCYNEAFFPNTANNFFCCHIEY